MQGHRSLSFESILGRDAKPKGRSQGSDNSDGRVQVVDWLEKPGTDFPDVVGLAVVGVGEAVVLEKRQEGVGGRRI